MKKILFLLTIAFLATTQLFAADKKEVLLSPNGMLKVEVTIDGKISYTIQCNDENLVVNSPDRKSVV